MKISEWKRAARPLLPGDEHWEFRGSLCYRLPVRRVLLGVLGEGSGFDKGIYVWRLTMPLFVPNQNVVLSWSERIGGGARKYYELDEDALAAAIAAAFVGLGTEKDALRRLVSRAPETSTNRRVNEAVGYAQLLLGDLPAAQEALTRAETGTARTPWEREIIERVQLIGQLLREGKLDRTVSQLDQWCDETAGALGLRRSVTSDRQT